MLHQVGVSFDLYYNARKHKIKILIPVLPKMYEITLSGAQRRSPSLTLPSGSHFKRTINHSLNLFKYSHSLMGTKKGKFGELNLSAPELFFKF